MRPYFLLGLMMTSCGARIESTSSDAGGKSPDAAETCAGEMAACTTRDDCCNARHSCIDGACMYSALSSPETGTTEEERVDFESAIQPLLYEKCAACHDGDAGLVGFASSYDVMLQPSTLCGGERVGECVNRALQAQAPEGSMCRTYITKPFHREGWPCLSADEIARVASWVEGGMLER